MANELNVNADGLRAAAASSDVIAAELATGTVDGGAGATPRAPFEC